MTRAVLPLALIFSSAGPALAAENFIQVPGQWETRHNTVINGQEEDAATAHCVDGEGKQLSAAAYAAMISPQGTCEILDTNFEDGLGLMEISCTQSPVGRASLLVITGEDEFSVYADAEFPTPENGEPAHGTIKAESRRVGPCSAP